MKNNIIFISIIGMSLLFGGCGIYTSSFYDTSSPHTYRTLSSQIASESQQKKIDYIVGRAENQTALANQVRELPQLKEISKKYQTMDLRPSLNKKNGKWGYVDEKSKFRISAVFDEVKSFKDGFAAIKIGNYWGFLKKDGTYLVKPQFTNVSDFDGNIAIVEKSAMRGFIKKDGTVIEPIYNSIVTFENNVLETAISNKTDVKTSQTVKSGKVFFVKRMGLWGILDVNCNVIKEPQYYGTVNGKSQKMWLSLDGKWGCIDSSGQILMDFVLKEEPNFIGKLAIVSVNEKLGILKDDFSYLVKTEFSQIKEFGLGTVLFVQKNGFWGIMKKHDGTYIVEPIMRKCPYSDGMGNVIVYVKNNIGVLTYKGEWLYKPQYSSYREIQLEMIKKAGYLLTSNAKLTSLSSQGNIVLVELRNSKEALSSISQGYITKKYGLMDKFIGYEFISDDFLNTYSLKDGLTRHVETDGRQVNYSYFCQDEKKHSTFCRLSYNDSIINILPFWVIQNNVMEVSDGGHIHTYNCKIEENKVAIDEADNVFYVARTADYVGRDYPNVTYLQKYNLSGIQKNILIDIHSIYADYVNKELKKDYIVRHVNTVKAAAKMVVNDIKILSNGNILLIYTVSSEKDFICILDKKDFSVINALTSSEATAFYGWSRFDGRAMYGASTRKYSIAKDGGFYSYSARGRYVVKADNDGNREWGASIDNDGEGQYCYNIAELNGKVYIAGTSTEYPYANFKNAILWEIANNGTEIKRIYLTNKRETECLGVFCKNGTLYCQILDKNK